MSEQIITTACFVGVATISLAVAVYQFVQKKEGRGTIYFWLGTVLLITAGVHVGTANHVALRVTWMLASIPALILSAHAAFLFFVRSKVLLKATKANVERASKIMAANGGTELDAVTYHELIAAGERYFNAPALLLRYAAPAVLILGVSLSTSNALIRSFQQYAYFNYKCDDGPNPTERYICNVIGDQKVASTDAGEVEETKRSDVVLLQPKRVIGASYGLVGAYAYVLLYLGRRAFRMDITPGAATWCAITMAIGPVLAGFLGPIFLKEPSFITGNGLAEVAALFLAGFSPKFVVTSIEEAGRRLLGGTSSPATLPARTLPLSQVRGMTKEAQDRLDEEGIDDACQLAMADPYRLIRNTSFDKRQILHFIDCALLMLHVPEAFAALDRRGVTGAMSLVWYVAKPERKAALEALAKDVRLDPLNLTSIAMQLSEDKQVNLVRLLYLFDGDANGQDGDANGQEGVVGDPQPAPAST